MLRQKHICAADRLKFGHSPPQPTASMSGHQGGDTSKLSLDLCLINKQLRTGKSRKGVDLEKIPGKREKLQEQKAAIVAKMEEAKQARHDERMDAINAHTTGVGENVKSCIKQELAPIKKDVAAIAQVLTASSNTIDKICEYHEKVPPSNPDDLDLMERVLNKFKVRRMNAILQQFNVERPDGVKREGKAALIVKNIPREELLKLLEAPEDPPASSTSRQPGRGLHAFFGGTASTAQTEPTHGASNAARATDASEGARTANVPPRKRQLVSQAPAKQERTRKILHLAAPANASATLADLYAQCVDSRAQSSSAEASTESPLSSTRSSGTAVAGGMTGMTVASALCASIGGMGDSGPAGPDGKPLFARLPEFVAAYLVFASDVLVRVGELEKPVFEHYLAELRDLNPAMADAYVETAHCTVSFLTDTTTLKLLHANLLDGKITANALYNIVIGQTVIPSWRKMEKLGPFNVDDPPTPEEFARRFHEAFPGQKAVVPSHLKQGVLGLLGKGPEVESAGRFIYELAAKIPNALKRLREGKAIEMLQEELSIPKFRALMVVRILSLGDRTLYDFEKSRDIGDYAELGLWLLEGMPPEQAREAAKDSWNKPAVDPLFAALIRALPAAIADEDIHGIVKQLTEMNIAPLCSQNVEHMLCEFRKMMIPEGRAASGERYEGYADLWKQCEAILARRAA